MVSSISSLSDHAQANTDRLPESDISNFADVMGNTLARPMAQGEKVPDYKHYTKMEKKPDGEIRFTFTDANGQNTNRLVREGDRQYGEVKADFDVYDAIEKAETQGVDGVKGYKVIDDIDTIPISDKTKVHKPDDKALSDRLLFVEYKNPDTGEREYGIAVKDLNGDIFGQVKSIARKESQAALDEKTEKGAELLVTKFENEERIARLEGEGLTLAQTEDDLPDSIIDISLPAGQNDVLIFDYRTESGDRRQGFVAKSVNEELHSKVYEMAREQWRKENPGLID